ncbi:MAG: DUF2807 domain-containing protein [Rikenellaceae bacterium]|mgnify:FL=1|nr:DUF2807 domain-containing protein [Rikenellaceae bacterium]MBR2420220.1 DUF2807 domain-containing protein [Rikenellaceae bacterium]MBR2932648.1 DUF2807 domain-containing protein [Rikenellaceae bacterium]
MKKIMLVVAALVIAFAANAQNDVRREWLGTFSSISLGGDMKVTLVPIEEGGQPMLIVKAEDRELSKLKYTINNKGELSVRESTNRKRTTRTEIEIHFAAVDAIEVVSSDVEVAGLIDVPILDIIVSNGGFFKAEIDTEDVMIKATGQSTVDLKGRARYLIADVTVAKIDLRQLESMSAEVQASQRGEVSVFCTERLAATANFGGTVFYRGNPSILRANSKLLGSSINSIE